MISKDNQIVVLGETNFRNQRWRFGIKPDDRRRHMYVVGSTGMGKSEFLKNMAIQDIEAGRGLAFIDPHGDSADALLDYIPKERLKDIIYFDPGDLSHPIAFNVMEKVGYEFRHLVASGLSGVFKKIFGVEVWSGRMEYILNNTILALLEYPDATLLGINKMLSNKEYRNKVVANVKDPIVRSFWVDEFAKYTDRYMQEATPAIQNKIGQFIANNLVRNVIGQVHSTIDVRKIMDDGKILIVNLSRGKIGEDASRLLGALLVTKIQLAAMSRVDILEKDRRDFFLYVDEFQHFATESFANILSEARKYHLSLIMAHQYIKQMEEPVMDAVFGNVGTIVSFRVGAEDGEYLEKWFQPDFLMNDIVNLGKRNMYLKLMIDGVSSKGFSAMTVDSIPKPDISYRDEAVEYSRKTYSTPREDVEKTISEWASMYESQEESRPKRDSYGPRSDRQSGGYAPRQQSSQNWPPYQRPSGERGSTEASRPNVRPSGERGSTEAGRPNLRPVQESPRYESRPTASVSPIKPAFETPAPSPVSLSTPPPISPPVKPVITEQPKVEIKPVVSKPYQRPSDERGSTEHSNANVGGVDINRPYMAPLPKPQFQTRPQGSSQSPKTQGLSLDQALKSGPVNFRGRRIEERPPKPKAEVNTDELKKALEEAMKGS